MTLTDRVGNMRLNCRTSKDIPCTGNLFIVCDSVACGSVVVKALCYKPEGGGFETRFDE
jgi:hypothetical protein